MTQRFRAHRGRTWHYTTDKRDGWGHNTLCGQVLRRAWRFALSNGDEPKPCQRCLKLRLAELEAMHGSP